MTLFQKNSKKQGDVGLGSAIYYFSKLGYTVSLPLTDSQDYDLIVDVMGQLKKVQVKTTRSLYKDKYQVQLRTNGGNKTGTSTKKFDPTQVDLLFVLTQDRKAYLIPSDELGGTAKICLTEKYTKFLLA